MNTEITLSKQIELLSTSSTGKIPVKKSWALMAIEEEEEEAREIEQEKQLQIQKQVQIRRELFEKGLYELEDGEILE